VADGLLYRLSLSLRENAHGNGGSLKRDLANLARMRCADESEPGHHPAGVCQSAGAVDVRRTMGEGARHYCHSAASRRPRIQLTVEAVEFWNRINGLR
jgi:hypothetical protein